MPRADAAEGANAMSTTPVFPQPVVVQVAVIVRDIEASARRYCALFGLPVPDILVTPGYATARTTFHGQPSEATAKLAFLNFGQVQIELIEPDDQPSVWRAFLDEKGEGVQHIALQVQNTQHSTDALAAQGIPVVQQGLYADGNGIYTYVGSEGALGVMLELLETFPR
jgi:methylmalonyl-CoA/ethylmalonyl-CoA epimerase